MNWFDARSSEVVEWLSCLSVPLTCLHHRTSSWVSLQNLFRQLYVPVSLALCSCYGFQIQSSAFYPCFDSHWAAEASVEMSEVVSADLCRSHGSTAHANFEVILAQKTIDWTIRAFALVRHLVSWNFVDHCFLALSAFWSNPVVKMAIWDYRS